MGFWHGDLSKVTVRLSVPESPYLSPHVVMTDRRHLNSVFIWSRRPSDIKVPRTRIGTRHEQNRRYQKSTLDRNATGRTGVMTDEVGKGVGVRRVTPL